MVFITRFYHTIFENRVMFLSHDFLAHNARRLGTFLKFHMKTGVFAEVGQAPAFSYFTYRPVHRVRALCAASMQKASFVGKHLLFPLQQHGHTLSRQGTVLGN